MLPLAGVTQVEVCLIIYFSVNSLIDSAVHCNTETIYVGIETQVYNTDYDVQVL